MGSFNDWDDDQDLYDWGSQFGGSSGIAKPSGQTTKKEVPIEEPAPAEPPTPVETPAPTETPKEEPTPQESVSPPSEAPKSKKKSLTKDELEKMASQQEECGGKAKQFLDCFQQLLSLCDPNQLPKGTRTIINHLDHVSCAALATKALVEYCLETNEEQKFDIFEESKLKQNAFSTYRMVQSYKDKLQDALDKFDERIKQDEGRHILNLSTQAIAKLTSHLESHVERQAKTYSETLDAYSPAQGALALLGRFANKGDHEVMRSIDNTLNLAGTDFVLTEDAPAMLEALERNDKDTIVRLQQKLIDHLFEKK